MIADESFFVFLKKMTYFLRFYLNLGSMVLNYS